MVISEKELYSILNDTVSLLARFEEECTSLAMLLSYISGELVGKIDMRHFCALAGTADILDDISREMQQSYGSLEKVTDTIRMQKSNQSLNQSG